MSGPAFLTPSATFAELFDAAYQAPARDTPRVGAPAPAKWAPWLTTMFPAHFSAAFATRHVELWRWAWALKRGLSPNAVGLPTAFIALWGRGGGKTTNAEAVTTALGVRDQRKYGLYVRDTQDRANDSVSNIAALLESAGVAKHYPAHADRKVSKFGQAKAWRRNRVWTAGGFVVDAIGLDTAARGAKIEDQRPDFIIVDDVDGKHDSTAVTAKKAATLATSILPAGSRDVAVLGVQNLITADSIFSQLLDGRAEFLADRQISGPHPAVVGLTTEAYEDPESGLTRHRVTGGTPTWAGQNLATVQEQIHLWGHDAFLKEAQHEVHARGEGLAVPVTDAETLDLTDAQVRTLVSYGQAFGGVDFGAWRFAFTLWAADPQGRAVAVHELFSQREEATPRARALHDICARYGIVDRIGAGHPFLLWGDAANPSDIRELNAAFRRLDSPLVCVAVGMANKQRKASVERINDARARGALKFRTTLGRDLAGQPLRWHLGMSADSAGVEMRGSRLRWELTKWKYPVPKPGEVQEQDPDDATADGADAIASMRYALMSYWSAGTAPERPARTSEHQHPGVGRPDRRPPALAVPAAPPPRAEAPAPWPGGAFGVPWDGHSPPTGYREVT